MRRPIRTTSVPRPAGKRIRRELASLFALYRESASCRRQIVTPGCVLRNWNRAWASALFNVSTIGGLLADLPQAASNSDTNNQIVLAPGTYTLAGATTSDILINNTTALTKVLTIEGGTEANTIVVGGAGWTTRIFEISGGTTLTVKLENLTIKGGDVTGNNPAVAAHGGGLLIDGGNVALSNVAVTGNKAEGAAGSGGEAGAVGKAGGDGGTGPRVQGAAFTWRPVRSRWRMPPSAATVLPAASAATAGTRARIPLKATQAPQGRMAPTARKENREPRPEASGDGAATAPTAPLASGKRETVPTLTAMRATAECSGGPGRAKRDALRGAKGGQGGQRRGSRRRRVVRSRRNPDRRFMHRK